MYPSSVAPVRTKIQSFTDLIAWQQGHALVLMLYSSTKLFPRDEDFALKHQIRKAAVSITSNIAEGFSRQSVRDKANFYTIALGSVTEIQNQILISRDVGYLTAERFDQLSKQSVSVCKILHGLITATKNQSFKIPASNV